MPDAGSLLGGVDQAGRPLVRLHVLGRDDELLCLVDTGFNGSLWLSETTAHRFGATPTEATGDAVVANARVEQTALAELTVRWLGSSRRVLAHVFNAVEGRADSYDALLGTALLREAELWIDFPNGSVWIEPGGSAR